MSPEQIEIERKAFEAHTRSAWRVPADYLDWALKRNERGEYQDSRAADQCSGWLARAEKAERVREALEDYMAAFGQALEANGIPYDKQQQEADAAARAALKDDTHG